MISDSSLRGGDCGGSGVGGEVLQPVGMPSLEGGGGLSLVQRVPPEVLDVSGDRGLGVVHSFGDRGVDELLLVHVLHAVEPVATGDHDVATRSVRVGANHDRIQLAIDLERVGQLDGELFGEGSLGALDFGDVNQLAFDQLGFHRCLSRLMGRCDLQILIPI